MIQEFRYSKVHWTVLFDRSYQSVCFKRSLLRSHWIMAKIKNVLLVNSYNSAVANMQQVAL